MKRLRLKIHRLNIVPQPRKNLTEATIILKNNLFSAVYPELWKFFPNMKGKFKSFGETILEVVGLQLRSVSSTLVPDVLCWLSELRSWPFSFTSPIGNDNLKGYNAKNARTIILYTLEAITIEHMEAVVPETPKLVHMLVSLSSSSYCDVPFLDSMLRLLKPIIYYSLSKVYHVERVVDSVGKTPVSSTDKILTQKIGDDGSVMSQSVQPRKLRTEEIPDIVIDFRLAANTCICFTLSTSSGTKTITFKLHTPHLHQSTTIRVQLCTKEKKTSQNQNT